MKLYFIRHGEAEFNLTHIHNYIPKNINHLTARGIKQAKESSIVLKTITFDAVFVSELMRARETAGILCMSRKIKRTIEPRINERRSGMEGKSEEEYLKLVQKDFFYKKLPGGESFQEEKLRLLDFLQSLKNKKYRNVLIVSHQEPIQIMLGILDGLSDEEMVKRILKNAEIVVRKLHGI